MKEIVRQIATTHNHATEPPGLRPFPEDKASMIPLSPRRALHATALAAALALGAAAAPAPALAAAPQVKTQAPGFYRVMLGDFEITALSDGTVDLPVDKLLKQPAAKTAAALRKSFLGLPAETSVNAYLVNTGTKLVLVDAGAGTLFGPTLGKLVANLQAAGYKPEQVDDVVITHMHPDHVGGLAANGALVFPNAVVHADKRDADFWLSPATLEHAPPESKGFVQGAMASLDPYVKAGRFQPFEGSGEIVPGVKALSTFGHTAGHTSYVVESGGQKLVVVGDLIHVGAVQFADPSVTIDFDTDGKAAAAARATVFAQAARDGALVGAAHLSFPGLGHLRAQGKSWQWLPLNYSTELK
jgi:glyoxylase-like metal-dependent hydrolase (beta-lactamase superfamily II)